MNTRRVGELTIAWDAGDLPHDAIAAAMPLELTGSPESRSPGDDRRPKIVVRARTVPERLPSPALSGAAPVLFHGETRCFRSASGFVVWDGASLLRVAEDGSQIDAQVHAASLAQPFHFASVTTTMALLLALRAHGYFHMHACAAAWPDGDRWLLPAESDAGKSTLGLALFQSGARWVTDDTLLLRRRGSAIEAVGWPRAMRMTKTTAAAFPELASAATPCPPGSARDLEIDPRQAFPGRAEPVIGSPFTLLFPRIALQPESRLLPLDRAEALGRCLHACAWVASEHLPRRDEQLALLAQMVDEARAYELLAGTGVLRDPRTEVALLRASLR